MRFSGSAGAPGAVVTAVLILAAAACVGARTVADPDLWGHVRFGQDILRDKSIPRTDPYSYLTEKQPWVNHEWAAEVTFAALFNAFGPPGLLLLKTLIIAVMAGLLYRHVYAVGGNALGAGAVVLAVAFLMLSGERTIRPQLFTYVFFLLLLLLLHTAETRSPRAMWLVPPLIAVWANFHGGFLAGLGLLLAWGTVRGGLTLLSTMSHRVSPATAAQARWKAVAACCALSLVAAMCNPYGPQLIRFLLRTATVARPDIEEWGAIDLRSMEGFSYLAVLAVCLLALAVTRRRRCPSLVALFLGTALLPLLAFRHLPLFALAGGVLVGEHLCDARQRWIARSPERAQSRGAPTRTAPAVALLALVGGVLFSGATFTNSLRIPIDPQHCPFPARAVALLKASKVSGNLAILFDWGEYAIWHLSPALKVSYDGRRETIYSERLCAVNNRWIFGQADGNALFDKYPTDLALIDKRFAGYRLLRAKAGWKLVYEDSLSALFARSEAQPLIRALAATPVPHVPADGAGLCFP